MPKWRQGHTARRRCNWNSPDTFFRPHHQVEVSDLPLIVAVFFRRFFEDHLGHERRRPVERADRPGLNEHKRLVRCLANLPHAQPSCIATALEQAELSNYSRKN